MEASQHQKTIIEFVKNGRGHVIVDAVAGSGKSTLLQMVARTLVAPAAVVCFNKAAADSLKDKLAGTRTQARTIHSLGVSAFSNVTVDDKKYVELAKAFVKERSWHLNVRKVVRVFDLMRLEMLAGDPEEINALLDNHDITFSDTELAKAYEVWEHLYRVGPEIRHSVDFTDMIWIPATQKAMHPSRFSWVLVDECQDLSPLHYAFLKKSLLPGGRMLFVGDRRQAIYHFAGASQDSFLQISEDLKATTLPLSVSYRCCKAVVREAKRYCSLIEEHINAPEGSVTTISRQDMLKMVGEGDMVLSRATAPLVALCFELIRERIQASVRGRDIGQGLVDYVDKLCANEDIALIDLYRRVTDKTKTEIVAIQRLAGVEDEDVLEARESRVVDRRECLKAIIDGCPPTGTSNDVRQAISSIFSDRRGSVQLSTIHRAKGLEADRVFFFDKYSTKATSKTAREQEVNLRYVATTRAKLALYLVAT